MHVASKIFNESPTPLQEVRPDLPPELCAVVMRCLRKRPEDRFPDVSALAQALAPFAPTHSVSAERIARIVAASLPSSQLPALADTVHDSKLAGSGETPHALVSARTPPIAGSRRWVVVAVASALAGATIVVILAMGRTPDGAARPTASPVQVVPPAEPTALVAPPSVISEEALVVEAPSASASASASAPASHAPPPTPTKRNPLSVGVK